MEKAQAKTKFGQKLDLDDVKIPAQLKGLNPFALIVGAAVGGAVMYMCDPVAGANRRSTLVSKVKSLGSTTSDGVTRQFSNISGLVSSLFSGWLNKAEDITSAATNTASRATATAGSYARKVAATDPDAFTATH